MEVLHRPPVVALPNVILEPGHTVDGPVIVPALAAGFIVSGAVVNMVPQPVVEV